jgi:uncharacterized protein YdhG (YjbR/CyaY superfamily)
MGKMRIKANSVDEYLANVPEAERAALEKLRKIIKSVAPDAIEVISYRIPVIKHKGRPLVGFGAARNHCSFYVMSSKVIPAFKERLKSYETATGTVHFSPDKPFPATLVKMLVKARIAENEGSEKKK